MISPAAAGAAARARGDFTAAEPLLRQALAVAESTEPRNDQALAVALNQLGLLCKDLGRWDEGRELYQRALALLERDPAADPHDIASIWHNLGGIAHARADFTAGETAARRGLAIRESAGSGLAMLEDSLEPDHPRLVACWEHAAGVA